jgi:hypothetical protein
MLTGKEILASVPNSVKKNYSLAEAANILDCHSIRVMSLPDHPAHRLVSSPLRRPLTALSPQSIIICCIQEMEGPATQERDRRQHANKSRLFGGTFWGKKSFWGFSENSRQKTGVFGGFDSTFNSEPLQRGHLPPLCSLSRPK